MKHLLFALWLLFSNSCLDTNEIEVSSSAHPSQSTTPAKSTTFSEDEWRRLHALTQETHSLLEYGPVKVALTNQNEIVAHGTGDCGHFSYLLAQKLISLGYSPRIWSARGVFSFVAHAVVEVNEQYVLDPTLGIVYRHSFLDLWSNPQDAQEYLGEYKELFKAYGGESFFANILAVSTESVKGSFYSNSLHKQASFTSSVDFDVGTIANLKDGNMGTTARSTASDLDFTWSWNSPVRGSFFSLVAENRVNSIGYDLEVQLWKRGELLWRSEKNAPTTKYGALGVWLPDTLTFDRLTVNFTRSHGAELDWAARDFFIIGEFE